MVMVDQLVIREYEVSFQKREDIADRVRDLVAESS